MAKKIILIFLGLVILIIGGLSVYISYMDWNAYKKQISEKFSEITGKKIELAGKISVSLLPQPTLKASNINIYNPNNPDQKLATIDNMSTNVSLSSLFSGSPDIRSLALVGAEIWIDINKKEELNWQSYSAVSGFGGSESNTRLQSLSLQNSLVHYNNESLGVKFDMLQANADVQADSLLGPYRLDGNFMKDNDHFGVAISIGNFAMLTDVSVNFAITHPKSESFLRFDGVYQMNEKHIKGDFSGGSQKTADFINIVSGIKVLNEEHNVPLQFSLGVQTDDENVKLSSFVIKYGDLIEGSGNIKIPLRAEEGSLRTAELKYQLVNLDIRPIISLIKAEYDIFKAKGGVYEPITKLNIIADLSSDRVVLNDTPFGYLENMGLKGSWKDNVLSVEEFRALGAGETLINVSGSLVSENKTPQYFMRTSLSGKDFLTFLKSIGLETQQVSQATYKNADLSFNLGGNSHAVSINDIKFSMDKMQITSVVGITFKDKSTIFDIQADADSVNLDNYLAKNEDTGSAVSNLQSYLQSLSFLKWYNVNCQFKAKNLIFRGVNFENPIIIFSSADGFLDVKTMSAEKAMDSSFFVSGKISNLGTVDVAFENVKYEVDSSALSDVIEKMQIPVPDWKLFEAKSFKSAGSYSGNLHEGNVEFDSTVDELRFNYKGKISQNENFGFDGNASLRTINFNEFFNNVGGSIQVNGNTRGALNCTGNVKGNTKQWAFNDTSCVLGIAKYTGNVDIEKANNTSKISGKVKVDDFNIETFMEIQNQKGGTALAIQRGNEFLNRPDFSKDVFVFDIYKNIIMDIELEAEKGIYKGEVFNNLNMHILNSENIMQLENIKFNRDGVETSGSIQINYMQNPIVKGVLEAKNIKVNEFGGNTYKIISGTANIKAIFGVTASSIDEFVNNYSGSVDFELNDFTLKGFDISKIITDLTNRTRSKGVFRQVRDSLQSGETSFKSLKGQLISSAGNMKFENTTMENDDVLSNISGTIGLGNWRMDDKFTFEMKNTTEIPMFSCNLSGMINKPVLDIDVTEVVEKYDAHWAKIEADAEAEKKAREKEVGEKMLQVQTKVAALSDEINLISPKIEEYRSMTTITETTEWYQSSLERINDINKDIDEMQAKSHIPGYTEEDVKSIEEKTAEYLTEVKAMSTAVEEKYLEDIAKRLENIREEFSVQYQENKDFFNEYGEILAKRIKDIVGLGYKENIYENEQIKLNQSRIKELADNVEELNNLFNGSSAIADNIEDTAILEETISHLNEKYSELKELKAEEDKTLNQATEVLDLIYDNQYKIYEEEQRKKAERQKKIDAENANNLLYEKQPISEDMNVVDNKENKTVLTNETNNIQTMQKNNVNDTAIKDETETEKSQPLLRQYKGENSKATVSSGQIKKSYEEAPEKEIKKKGILRPAEGAVTKVTGTIVVK